MDESLLLSGLSAAPLITALVAAIGQAAPGLPRRAYPLLAVALGVAWQCGVAAASGQWAWTSPFAGVLVGLAACGLYSAAVKPAAALARAGR
jgi:hypothetical protein